MTITYRQVQNALNAFLKIVWFLYPKYLFIIYLRRKELYTPLLAIRSPSTFIKLFLPLPFYAYLSKSLSLICLCSRLEKILISFLGLYIDIQKYTIVFIQSVFTIIENQLCINGLGIYSYITTTFARYLFCVFQYFIHYTFIIQWR